MIAVMGKVVFLWWLIGCSLECQITKEKGEKGKESVARLERVFRKREKKEKGRGDGRDW